MGAKPLFSRPWSLFAVAWFLSHIPTTILVDAQAVLPPEYFPLELRQLLQWHVDTSGDHLIRDRPVWFVSFIWFELLVQLPFFFVAAYAYAAGKNWIRIPAIMYGIHAATTTIPMLADFVYGAGANNPNKYVCVGYYVVYMAVPLLIALHMAFSRIPFPAETKKKLR